MLQKDGNKWLASKIPEKLVVIIWMPVVFGNWYLEIPEKLVVIVWMPVAGIQNTRNAGCNNCSAPNSFFNLQ